MSALKEAMLRAGVHDVSSRLTEISVAVLRNSSGWDCEERRDDPAQMSKLREIAMDAARANRRNFEGARSALYKAVCNDAALLWAMFEPYRSAAADNLLRDGYALLAEQERRVVDARLSGGGGQSKSDSQRASAPAAENSNAGESSRSGSANAGSRPNQLMPPAPNLTPMADRQASRMASRLQTAERLSKLDTVMIGGRPIGDCTVSEVRAWAKTRLSDARSAKRDAVFALNLAANLDGSAVIREHWKNADEVDAMYVRAEVDNAA